MRRPFAVALALVIALTLSAAVFVRLRVQRTLVQGQREVGAQDQLPFDLLPLAAPPAAPVFEPLPTPAAYVTGAVLHGALWLGGAGGLAVYRSPSASPRLLNPGAELPPAPVVALAAGLLRGEAQPAVIAATHGEGVLLFPERGDARQLLPRDPALRDVTAVLPLGSGDLLLGTRRSGVLVYRGALRGSDAGNAPAGTLQPFAPGLREAEVTALAGNEGDLWVGTRDRGLLRWHAGQLDTLDTLDTAAGLPDAQIESLAVAPGEAFAGTPRGVAEFRDGRFVRVLAPDLFARELAVRDGHLLIATIDQGVEDVALTAAAARPGRHAEASQALGGVSGFFAGDGKLFALGSGSVFAHGEATGGWTPVLSTPRAPFTDRNIAALSVGLEGRLWIGYFNRGLDVWRPGAPAAQHLEDDHLFCVNRIVNDPLRHTVDVATANGLALFDPAAGPLKPRSVLLRRDGLIADHVSDVAFAGDTTVLATPAGLTFLSPHGAESLYAFQGLVNNHVYTLASDAAGGPLVAGTLGGVSLLQGGQVRRNVTVANSALQHNWITAVLPVGSGSGGAEGAPGYLLGTYGAGVMAMDAAGHVSALEGATRPAVVVNPNAMLRTQTHVFVGTLSDGLLIGNLSSGRWSQVTAGLPSRNVTSLAFAGNTLYVGTDNGLLRAEEARLAP